MLALSATYRRDRLLSFINPFAHASTTGYQVVQSLATLGLGGVTGSGVGASVTPWGFLPNAHTDFVFAVIAGNLGLVGALVVLAGFAAFGWAGFRIAAREKDPFARFVAIGITCWVLAQAVINIGGVVDALPVTGIPLPFISYGGSSLVVVLVGGRAAVRDRAAPGAQRRRRKDGCVTRVPARLGTHLRPPHRWGTAGHVQPALAVGEALVARGHDSLDDRLRRLAARHGGTARARGRLRGHPAARKGHPTAPHAREPRRRRRPSASPACSALAIVLRRRPRVVVTVGGYAGLPCSLAAILLRVPLVVVSYDAVPGASNRLVARFARKCAVAFEGSSLAQPGRDRSAASQRGPRRRAAAPQGRGGGPRQPRGARGPLPPRRRGRLARRATPQRGRARAGQVLGVARRRHDLPRRRRAEPRRT